MAETTLFNIFGDDITQRPLKNVTRQPLGNIENLGKTVSSGPYKPNEPMKKAGEPKKSFLSNIGKALQVQSTPAARQVFSPRSKNKNVGSMIYNDEEVKFTKPKEIKAPFQYLELFEIVQPQTQYNSPVSVPKTPPFQAPVFHLSYADEVDDDFLNFSDDSLPNIADDKLPNFSEDNLPDISDDSFSNISDDSLSSVSNVSSLNFSDLLEMPEDD